MDSAQSKLMKFHTLSWTQLVIITFLSAYLYIFMEWLFTVTRPSFMRTLNIGRQLEVFFFTAAVLALVTTLLVSLLPALGRIPALKRYGSVLSLAAAAVPAVLLACMLLLLLDNFTYTLLRFGIVSTHGLWRGVYALIFLGLAVLAYRFVLRDGSAIASRLEASLRHRKLYGGLLILGLIPLVVPLLLGEYQSVFRRTTAEQTRVSRPDILFITSDGISAAHTSLYEYQFDTTPTLASLSATSLVAENAFANSGNTPGSITAFLTGKFPSDTRVLYRPDILHDMDSYEHLPGILQSYGYFTAQISYPYYVDAYSLNFLDAFDLVNGQSQNSGLQTALRRVIPNNYAYFLNLAVSRLGERLQHIFYLKEMTNPYALVSEGPGTIDDQLKFDELSNLLQTTEAPLFVHLHAMGTHGPYFYPKIQKFSSGIEIARQPRWDDRFYHDSIYEFDGYLNALVHELRQNGQFDNTILIVASDHPEVYQMTQRIPFLIHFPEDQHAGLITNNVQSIDLAPTLLDYLEIDIPNWMHGISLLDGDPEQRPVFGFGVGSNAANLEGHWMIDETKVKAPFYQFQTVTMEYCQNWYELNLDTGEMKTGRVLRSTADCPQEDLPDSALAIQWIADHLEAYGFDVSQLR